MVETVGKLEGNTHALERRRESLPEAFRPGEAEADARLKLRIRRRVAEGFRKNWDREVVVLELGEEEQGLGAQGPALRLGQQLVPDRPGARPLPRSEMRTSRGEPPPVALVAIVRRGQAERVLGEFGRESRCATIGREPRSVAEHGRWIPARPLVDAEQRLPRKRPVHAVAKEPMERAHAERPHSQLPDVVCTQGSFEFRPLLHARLAAAQVEG
jgi:hypothetical protein